MSLVLESEEKIGDDVLKTPLFTLYDSHIVIRHKDEKKVFNLNEITNVRLQKKRNFSKNIFFLFFTLLVYSFASDYFDRSFVWNILLFVITIASSVVSLSIEHYSYVLYINMTHFGYRKLIMAKKDVANATYIVSLFKNGYLKKYC
jgi:magnesium-transporting ATPase (P-type)